MDNTKQQARKKVTEKRLVDVLVCHYRPMHPIRREVKYYEKRIDVSLVHCESNEVWAIEAKVEAWGRALGQAIVNLAAAHRSYIAIYSEYAHRVDIVALEANGIGLISVGRKWGEVEVLLEASRSKYTNSLASQEICEHVSRR